MSIQREYQLPNCKLLLEGLSDPQADGDRHDAGSVMSVLVNAECYLGTRDRPLSGGVEFFQSLVSAVSNYAQEFLSGVHRHSLTPALPESPNGSTAPVQLQKITQNSHRLIVHPPDSHNSTPIQIDLSTVQLFDLVEAVDRFFADPQTLPQMGLQLQSVTKTEAKNQQPIAERALPAAVGVSSLAVAALALFLMPMPEVQRPIEPVPEEARDESGALVNPTASGEGTANPAPNGTPPSAAELETSLQNTREITDADQLSALQEQLSNEIDRAWTPDLTFDENLVYRVTVGRDGAILGYRAENEAAQNYDGETPLFYLVYIPMQGDSVTDQEIASFRVEFTSDAQLNVEPWENTPAEETSGVAPETNRARPVAVNSLPEIENRALLEQLQDSLYSSIDRLWTEDPQFDGELLYRVWLARDGAIVDYEPQNSSAQNYLNQTPLENLHQPTAGVERNQSGGVLQEPLAPFRVVFTPNGILQVSPWNGYR